ncbi:MAG: HAMP domain-containing sensor histidine kinase [Deltaproteobacteria bacterium]|nr:HAMP domain-containing sensor histidine kinase [Deltaproteobacteria bacterium]
MSLSKLRSILDRRLGFQGAILLGVFGSVLALSVVVLLFTQRYAEDLFHGTVNPEVQELVEAPLSLYPELLRARRETHLLRTSLLARDPVLLSPAFDAEAVREHLLAQCADDPYLRRIEVVRPDAPALGIGCPQGADEGPVRTLLREAELGAGGKLRVTFGMPEAVFAGHARAGELARGYAERVRNADRMRAAYQRAFAVVLGAWILLGGAIASYLSRRTTRRLRALAEATTRLSTGELDVQVQVDGQDELARLAEAFNTMVVELGERREQIVYLERVSSWQGIARRLAHEIKNPLTPIQLAMQQLVSSYSGDDPRFQKLLAEVEEIVGEEVQTLRRLVTAFSEFAKLPDVDVSPAHLGQYLQDYLRSHPDLSAEAEIELLLPETDPRVELDRALLGRVLTNLLRNAIEAAAPLSEGLPRVEVQLEVGSEAAVVRVSDEGPGIAADYPSQIFDPYFTTKSTGTGLGLAISRKIVLQHGGELTVAPRSGPGTTFEIRLPLAGRGPLSGSVLRESIVER